MPKKPDLSRPLPHDDRPLELPPYLQPEKRDLQLPARPGLVHRSPQRRDAVVASDKAEFVGVYRPDPLPEPAPETPLTVNPDTAAYLQERGIELGEEDFAKAAQRATGISEPQALELFDRVTAVSDWSGDEHGRLLPPDQRLSRQQGEPGPDRKLVMPLAVSLGNLSKVLIHPDIEAFSDGERAVLSQLAEQYAAELQQPVNPEQA